MRKKYIVLSGAPGVGKSAVLRYIRERRPEFLFAVSSTTRTPRPEEKADDYDYVDTQTFLRMIEEEQLLEWVYTGYYYGTPRSVLENLKTDEQILLDLDTQGGIAVKAYHPEETLLIFLDAPKAEIERRLRQREEGRMAPEEIETRLARIETERARANLHYDAVVQNLDFETCLREILSIIDCQERE